MAEVLRVTDMSDEICHCDGCGKIIPIGLEILRLDELIFHNSYCEDLWWIRMSREVMPPPNLEEE